MKRFGMTHFSVKQKGSRRKINCRALIPLILMQILPISIPFALSQNGPPSTREARTQIATALEKKKDYKGMIEVLAEHKDKVGRSGLLLLARAYSKLQRFNEEIAVLELANARHPKDAALQTSLAAALGRAGRHDAAIEAYYRARDMNLKYVPAYEGLLAELIKIESRQEARDLLTDMMKRFGQKGKWLSELCALYTADAFYEKAVETCELAIKKDSKNPKTPVNLAKTFLEQEKPEKAKKVLVNAAIKIRGSEIVQTALGEYFLEKKNFIDAFLWFKAGVKSNPKSYTAQIGLAQSALELQKMEDSVNAFTAACRLDRKAIREFQSALGKIRQRGEVRWQGRFEDAIANSCRLSF
jgi:tetratricopeptide (TPR) repeat protein